MLTQTVHKTMQKKPFEFKYIIHASTLLFERMECRQMSHAQHTAVGKLSQLGKGSGAKYESYGTVRHTPPEKNWYGP
jgi:hypothetical protein